MKDKLFLLNIIKKIESLKQGIIVYGYFNENHSCWEISVSDYDFYMNNKTFNNLLRAWQKIASIKGFKIIFVCGWIPDENKLLELSENDNLILNIF